MHTTDTHKVKTIYTADGSYVIDVGGTVFGPYGPGECDVAHPSGMCCRHMKGHGGCHSTWDETTTEKVKYRWW